MNNKKDNVGASSLGWVKVREFIDEPCMSHYFTAWNNGVCISFFVLHTRYIH